MEREKRNRMRHFTDRRSGLGAGETKQCNTLQHTATHCNTLETDRLADGGSGFGAGKTQCTATHCNILQHTAAHCNTRQHTATHGNTLETDRLADGGRRFSTRET